MKHLQLGARGVLIDARASDDFGSNQELGIWAYLGIWVLRQCGHERTWTGGYGVKAPVGGCFRSDHGLMLGVSRTTTAEQASQCSVRMEVDVWQGFDIRRREKKKVQY